MKDKDRSLFAMLKARNVLLVLLIVAIMVAVWLVRGRSPLPVASVEKAAGPTENHPFVQPTPADRFPTGNGTDTVEVCGYGRVSIDKEDPSSIFRRVGALTKGAEAHWRAALQDSGDLRARVAGLLLEGKITGGDSIRPVAEQTRDAVAQLAAGAEDPAVYAMAVSFCGTLFGTRADSACQQISLQRWAQIDSDNAVPWLFLAAKPRAAHDGAAEASAFRAAARAHRVDSYSDSVYTFAATELPQDVTPLERAYFAIEVTGVEAAMVSPQYGTVQHCSIDAVQDGDVRQQCDSLAELLVGKGTTLLDLGVGRTLGARAGWSNARISELMQEQRALMQAIRQATPSDNDEFWTCDGVSRMNRYMTQRARLGELGAARDALERSGESIEAMAQKYTDFTEGLRREALERVQANPQGTAP